MVFNSCLYMLRRDEFSSFAIVDLLPYDPSNPHPALNIFVQVKLALTIWAMLIVTLICNSLMFQVKITPVIWAFSWFFDFIPWILYLWIMSQHKKKWHNDTFTLSNSLIHSIHNSMQFTHVPCKVSFHNLGIFLVFWLSTMEYYYLWIIDQHKKKWHNNTFTLSNL